MKIPEIDESIPVQYHWEKVAFKMINNLWKNQKAWIFHEKVVPEKLGIYDYFDIIKNPMDFSLIKEKLKSHQYLSMKNFLEDIELVFANCILYNGEASQVSHMCREVQEDYNK